MTTLTVHGPICDDDGAVHHSLRRWPAGDYAERQRHRIGVHLQHELDRPIGEVLHLQHVGRCLHAVCAVDLDRADERTAGAVTGPLYFSATTSRTGDGEITLEELSLTDMPAAVGLTPIKILSFDIRSSIERYRRPSSVITPLLASAIEDVENRSRFRTPLYIHRPRATDGLDTRVMMGRTHWPAEAGHRRLRARRDARGRALQRRLRPRRPMSDRPRRAGDAYAEMLAREHEAGIDVFAFEYGRTPPPTADDEPPTGDPGEPAPPKAEALPVARRTPQTHTYRRFPDTPTPYTARVSPGRQQTLTYQEISRPTKPFAPQRVPDIDKCATRFFAGPEPGRPSWPRAPSPTAVRFVRTGLYIGIRRNLYILIRQFLGGSARSGGGDAGRFVRAGGERKSLAEGRPGAGPRKNWPTLWDSGPAVWTNVRLPVDASSGFAVRSGLSAGPGEVVGGRSGLSVVSGVAGDDG